VRKSEEKEKKNVKRSTGQEEHNSGRINDKKIDSRIRRRSRVVNL